MERSSSQSFQAHAFHDLDVHVDTGTADNVPSLAITRVEEAVRVALGSAVAEPADGSADMGVGAATGTAGEALPGSSHPAQYGPGDFPVNAPPLPPPRPPLPVLHALQEWEGYVLELNADEFVAALVDLTSGSSHEEEEAIIPLTEIAENDAATLRAGAIFRWVIGYERSPSGTKKRVSQIVFRDLPRMTERDMEQGREWARQTRRAFKL